MPSIPVTLRSKDTKGRGHPEDEPDYRTVFQRDRDRILHTTAFRRLEYKTQVFVNHEGDLFRTRLTHSLEVSQIARTIARAMFLNEDLAEAIALGHDLGHTPFGHGGEAVLQEIHSADFSHHKQSLRVVDVIENNGNGLNLTHEVRDGILKHSKGYGKILPDNPDELACTMEGRIVRISDIMAYLNHDLDDAVRSGVVREDQVPEICLRVIGRTHQERATTMIRDLIFSSRPAGGELKLAMSNEVFGAMTTLRTFLYENVYRSARVHREFIKAKKILSELYAYLLENEAVFEKELIRMGIAGCMDNGQPREQVVCDFIASITDRYALNLYQKIFFPSPTV